MAKLKERGVAADNDPIRVSEESALANRNFEAERSFEEGKKSLTKKRDDYTRFIDICTYKLSAKYDEKTMSSFYRTALKIERRYQDPEMGAMLELIRTRLPCLRQVR